MIKTATKYTPAPLPSVPRIPGRWFFADEGTPEAERAEEFYTQEAARNAAAAELITSAAAVLFTIPGSDNGRYIIASPSTYTPGAVQLSFFDRAGAIRHETHSTATDAAENLPHDAQPAAAIRF